MSDSKSVLMAKIQSVVDTEMNTRLVREKLELIGVKTIQTNFYVPKHIMRAVVYIPGEESPVLFQTNRPFMIERRRKPRES